MKILGNQEIQGNLNVTGNITKNGVAIDVQTTDNSLVNSNNVFDLSLVGYGTASAGRDTSGKQRVEPNQRYYITYAEFPTSVDIPEGAIRYWYDVNGNVVTPTWGNTPLEADNSFIIPSNVYFIEWLKTAGAISERTQLIKCSDLVTPIVLNGMRYIASGKIFDTNKVNVIDEDIRRILLPLWGKKWAACGDSITQQNKYAVFLKRPTGLIQFVNTGVSGAQTKGIFDPITVAQVEEADVITALVGTNDYGLGFTPLGVMGDASTVDTFYGHVRYALETIYNKIEATSLTRLQKSQKLVCIATPLMRGTAQGYTPPAPGTNGKTLLQIRNAILEVCAEFGTPVYDAYALSGINQINIEGDELHPLDEQSVYGVGWGKFLNMHYKGL